MKKTIILPLIILYSALSLWGSGERSVEETPALPLVITFWDADAGPHSTPYLKDVIERYHALQSDVRVIYVGIPRNLAREKINIGMDTALGEDLVRPKVFLTAEGKLGPGFPFVLQSVSRLPSVVTGTMVDQFMTQVFFPGESAGADQRIYGCVVSSGSSYPEAAMSFVRFLAQAASR